jgi:thiol-disulfide isomerase/thioredoxin
MPSKHLVIIATLLLAFTAAKAQYTTDSAMFAAARPTHLQDKPFPAFAATSIDSAQWSEKSFTGKVTLVNYWFIGCLPCMLKIPYVNALRDSVGNADFQMLSFARNTRQRLRSFLHDKNNEDREDARSLNRREVAFHYDIIPACTQDMKKPGDGNCPYVDKPGIVAYPTALLIDKKGIVRDIRVGFNSPVIPSRDGNLFNEPDVKADFDALKMAIEKLLKE